MNGRKKKKNTFQPTIIYLYMHVQLMKTLKTAAYTAMTGYLFDVVHFA